MTKYEKIKAMSIEELAEYLVVTDWGKDCYYDIYSGFHTSKEDAAKRNVEILKSDENDK